MKYIFSIFLLLSLGYTASSQNETDFKLKAFAPVLEGSVALQVERSISPHLAMVGGIGYNNTKFFNEISQYFVETSHDSGLLGELGMRYYHRPYFQMDQLFSLLMIKFQGPSSLSGSASTLGAAFGIGAKHVFSSRVLAETYIGYTFNSASNGSLRPNRSSAPLLLWGLNIGYRITGDTSKGTAAYYQKKSPSKRRKRRK